MFTQRSNRSALVAALVAASLKLGGQNIEIRTGVPEANLADELVKRAMQTRFARAMFGELRSANHSRMYRNGGQRRKRAIRARRMHNAGHGNKWSARHG